MNHPPVVLVFGGTDPTSGAGVQAASSRIAARQAPRETLFIGVINAKTEEARI